MRITKIEVEGLFGMFDHEIPLRSSDRVTIIHGPNGFGKTMILKMVAGLISGKPAVFEHTPFSEFSLTLDDGSQVLVRRRETRSPEVKRPEVELSFCVRDPEGSITETVTPPPTPPQVLDTVDRLVPAPYRRSGGGWQDNEGSQYSLVEILQLFPNAAVAVPAEFRPGFPALRDLPVFFVQADRLGGERWAARERVRRYSLSRPPEEVPEEPPPRVDQYSHDIVERVRSILADYAKHSQESDRTFPERLVRFVRGRQRPLPELEILEKMAELESKRRRLVTLGLLDSEKGLRDLTEEDVRGVPQALTIYVEDVQQKLKVFDDIAQRIGTLMDIVNARFQYKRLSVDRQRGFRILSEVDQPVELRDLSSGEQHELVVLYELLFRTPTNGLVLIDEPEISLHAAWQSRFLTDLIQILGLADAYAIVATHSPIIIGERWDLTVELEGPPPRVAVPVASAN